MIVQIDVEFQAGLFFFKHFQDTVLWCLVSTAAVCINVFLCKFICIFSLVVLKTFFFIVFCTFSTMHLVLCIYNGADCVSKPKVSSICLQVRRILNYYLFEYCLLLFPFLFVRFLCVMCEGVCMCECIHLHNLTLSFLSSLSFSISYTSGQCS